VLELVGTAPLSSAMTYSQQTPRIQASMRWFARSFIATWRCLVIASKESRARDRKAGSGNAAGNETASSELLIQPGAWHRISQGARLSNSDIAAIIAIKNDLQLCQSGRALSRCQWGATSA
jgi:hypothetical protein